MTDRPYHVLFIPLGHPRSKRWDEFATGDGSSRDMDIIVTVCDSQRLAVVATP